MVDGRNDASLRLCARLGMRREAELLSNEWFKGEWTDEIDFALLDSEWLAMHPGGVSSCGLGPSAAAHSSRVLARIWTMEA